MTFWPKVSLIVSRFQGMFKFKKIFVIVDHEDFITPELVWSLGPKKVVWRAGAIITIMIMIIIMIVEHLVAFVPSLLVPFSFQIQCFGPKKMAVFIKISQLEG